jgi:hypothetical protein
MLYDTINIVVQIAFIETVLLKIVI